MLNMQFLQRCLLLLLLILPSVHIQCRLLILPPHLLGRLLLLLIWHLHLRRQLLIILVLFVLHIRRMILIDVDTASASLAPAADSDTAPASVAPAADADTAPVASVADVIRVPAAARAAADTAPVTGVPAVETVLATAEPPVDDIHPATVVLAV